MSDGTRVTIVLGKEAVQELLKNSPDSVEIALSKAALNYISTKMLKPTNLEALRKEIADTVTQTRHAVRDILVEDYGMIKSYQHNIVLPTDYVQAVKTLLNDHLQTEVSNTIKTEFTEKLYAFGAKINDIGNDYLKQAEQAVKSVLSDETIERIVGKIINNRLSQK